MTVETPSQQDPNPQDVIEGLTAQLDEAEALIGALRQRCAALNIEVRNRDALIADLKAKVPTPARKRD